jgi:hypothetical protein
MTKIVMALSVRQPDQSTEGNRRQQPVVFNVRSGGPKELDFRASALLAKCHPLRKLEAGLCGSCLLDASLRWHDDDEALW